MLAVTQTRVLTGQLMPRVAERPVFAGRLPASFYEPSCVFVPRSGRNRSPLFQSRQAINRLARFLLREPEVIHALQVEPELRACAEEMRETQCRVAGD